MDAINECNLDKYPVVSSGLPKVAVFPSGG